MLPPAADHPGDAPSDLPAWRREVFEARLECWLPDLREALRPLYVDHDAVVERLVALAAAAYASRDDDLHRLDLQRSLRPDWFQRPGMVGYAAYADRFADTLAGVADRAAYLTGLGVRYLHLMPLLTPRPAPNDGGYAVQDFRSVRPDLGTTTDLRALTKRLRGGGISLCLDLVLNHVAREHEWAVRARAGEATYRDYFLVYPDRSLPDAFEWTLPEVFPDFAPGSFTWDAELDGWVWTTFNHYQWDVNWANPDVLCEYAGVILDLANHGVEVFRLDAIAFTWKRMGTSCQNQPEVHALTQALRTVARIACPAVVFKAEAIVGPQDLLAYLGQGPHHGKVSDLAYHNGLMVQIWAMLASQDARLASQALQALPAPPSTTAWVTYARCHDDIGWAVSDEDAGAVGLSGFEHRRFLSDWYAGEFPGSWARAGVPGEPRDRRPAHLRVAGVTGRAGVRGPRSGRPDPARARGRARLRRAAGDLDGRRAGAAERPVVGRRARARGGQPLGAPAPDAVAAAGRHARDPGRRAAPGDGASLPAAPARGRTRDGPRPPRPGCAAGCAASPGRLDARRVQRHVVAAPRPPFRAA